MNISILIPQLFYDLIGRMVPGAALFGCAFFIYQGPREAIRHLMTWSSGPQEVNIPTVLILLGNLLLSYVLGALLGGLWFFASPLFLDRNKALTFQDQFEKIPKLIVERIGVERTEYYGGTAFMYDYIQIRCPNAGSRIAKLRAEQHMSGVLIVGAVMLSISYALVVHTFDKLSFWMIEFILALGIVAAILLARHLENRFSIAILNYYLLALSGIIEGEQPKDTGKPEAQKARAGA